MNEEKNLLLPKGITLIALIITIIIMLILAAVTISVAVNGGLFTQGGEAAKRTDIESAREKLVTAITAKQMEKMYTEDGVTQDDINGILSNFRISGR